MFQWLEISRNTSIFSNAFSGDLFSDALILELFQICLALSQTLGEGAL